MAIDKDKVFELFGRYWEIAYNEGRTGEGFADLANDVLAELRDALDADDGEVFTAMLVNINGHDYGLRPGAARIVREALRDAGRIDWIARMSKTSTVYMDNQHPWNVAGNYRFNNLRGQTFRDAINAAMAKDGV